MGTTDTYPSAFYTPGVKMWGVKQRLACVLTAGEGWTFSYWSNGISRTLDWHHHTTLTFADGSTQVIEQSFGYDYSQRVVDLSAHAGRVITHVEVSTHKDHDGSLTYGPTVFIDLLEFTYTPP